MRFRLFFGIRLSKAKVIVYAWVNDLNRPCGLRRKSDPYAVFREDAWAGRGNPPDDWPSHRQASRIGMANWNRFPQ